MSSSVIGASGSTQRKVICESCGHEYEYTLNCTATGTFSGYARTRAEADEHAKVDALKNLKHALETECHIVPCPKCQALTQQMQEKEQGWRPGALAAAGLCAVGVLVVIGIGLKTGVWYYGFGVTVLCTGGACLSMAINGPTRRDLHGNPITPTRTDAPTGPPGPPCVSCEQPTILGHNRCPHCGWQQPFESR